MGGTAPDRRVLVIGLDPYRVPGPWDPEPVATAIDSAMEELARHGLEAETCLVGLDGSDDIEACVTAVLLDDTWDCVVVGGGISKSEELMELFESILNLVHRHASSAEIALSSNPGGILEAVSRRFGPADGSGSV